jgi:hypothetical protein
MLIYFNMKIILNGWIDLLNLKMKVWHKLKKMYFATNYGISSNYI